MNKQTQIWLLIFVLAGGFLLYRISTHGMGKIYVESVDNQLVQVPAKASVSQAVQLSWARTTGLWVGAFFTLCIFSFLYRDNPFYKFAESVLIGASAAYWMVVAFWTVVVPNLMGRILPLFTARWATPGIIQEWDLSYYIPLVLGVMLLWRLAPQGGWISRWPLALIIGTTAGMRLVVYLEADFLSQIRSTILPLLVLSASDGSFDLWGTLKNWTILTGVLSGLVYFFFSAEHTGLLKPISRVGIWFLMITFGAAFGNTVMGRITLLSQRMEFLFNDWLWIIDPALNRLGM